MGVSDNVVQWGIAVDDEFYTRRTSAENLLSLISLWPGFTS